MAEELDERVLEEQTFVRRVLPSAAQGEEQVSLDRGGAGGRWHHDGLTIDHLDRDTPAGTRLERDELGWLEMRMSEGGHVVESPKWGSGLLHLGRAAE